MLKTNKRPFEIIQKYANTNINVPLYIYMFNAPQSEWAIIEGMQVIFSGMIVYFDNVNYVDQWFNIVNAINIFPVLGGNPLTNTGAKSSKRVPNVQVLPVDGYGYLINNQHTTIVEVQQRQEFGFELQPTANPWANPENFVARIWGNFITREGRMSK